MHSAAVFINSFSSKPQAPRKGPENLVSCYIATSSKFEFICKLALEKINSDIRVGSELARAFEFPFSWCPVF